MGGASGELAGDVRDGLRALRQHGDARVSAGRVRQPSRVPRTAERDHALRHISQD